MVSLEISPGKTRLSPFLICRYDNQFGCGGSRLLTVATRHSADGALYQADLRLNRTYSIYS
jgi:hypothetical protein